MQEQLPTRESPRSPRWIASGVAVGIALLAGVLIVADGRKILAVAGSIDTPMLLLPLACTLGSYAAMALSYQRIASLAGVGIRYGEMLRVALVSTSANYLVSTGGLSGLAARTYYFSQHHRLSWGNAFSISLAQTFITNLVLFAFLLWGLLHLTLHEQTGGVSFVFAAFLFVVSLAFCIIAVSLIAHRGARLKLMAGLVKIADAVSGRFARNHRGLRARLELFAEELHEGVDFMIARGWRMLMPFVYICLDWFLMLATLYVSFHCVRQAVPMSTVAVGFSIGVFLSLINIVPGGLGIMEGSMAAAFAGLGVPLESAVVATLIYRVAYYLLPLAVSLVLFRGMMMSPLPVASRRGGFAEHSAP